ncbi:hypothetical protein IQ07DRAFT_425869, partial [Pyrenochaeta sp. DS3sAY3a]
PAAARHACLLPCLVSRPVHQVSSLLSSSSPLAFSARDRRSRTASTRPCPRQVIRYALRPLPLQQRRRGHFIGAPSTRWYYLGSGSANASLKSTPRCCSPIPAASPELNASAPRSTRVLPPAMPKSIAVACFSAVNLARQCDHLQPTSCAPPPSTTSKERPSAAALDPAALHEAMRVCTQDLQLAFCKRCCPVPDAFHGPRPARGVRPLFGHNGERGGGDPDITPCPICVRSTSFPKT